MNLLEKINSNLNIYSANNSFCINDIYYTYADFAKIVSNIRHHIRAHIDEHQLNICLLTNDDIETYASIIALWFEGKSYVPISETSPIERNELIFKEVNSKVILTSESLETYHNVDAKVLETKNLQNKKLITNFSPFPEERLAYILFTSGSTGIPKGVLITFKNLEALIENISVDPWQDIMPSDKCLQMFELTFDFSVISYLMPLLSGASVYTIPKNQIKYLYIYKLLITYKLTFLNMVPSIINYLKPYFHEINIESVRFCCFGGAPLYIDVLEQWKKCIPNALFYNIYGPTECTVMISYYSLQENKVTKTINGVVSLGKPMKNIIFVIIDENLKILSPNKEGELCIAGDQLSNGYINNKEKNKASFFQLDFKGKKRRFYKTGDLCILDSDGYLNFIGRKDFQVKIGGFRIELSEIDYYLREFLKNSNSLALDLETEDKNKEIVLIIESEEFITNKLMIFLKQKLPNYMIPSKIEFIDKFPINSNGKIDRNQIRKILNK